MAKNEAQTEEVVDDTLVDVGDENENPVEVILEPEETNPNVIEQLADADEEVEAKADERTPEQKIKDYLDSDEELKEHYSRTVQKRIDKLTYEKHEAERREQAATDYARGVQSEIQNLKTKQQHQDGIFINEHKGRLEAQMEAAKQSYRDAVNQGDPDLIADANTLLSQTAAELAQAKQTETRFERFIKTTPAPSETIIPYEPEPRQPVQPQPDEKAEAWAEKNTWFGEDEDMTQAALAIHKKLVTEEGYIPTGDGYYAELDSRLRKNFPANYKSAQPVETPEISGQTTVTPTSSASSTPKVRGKKNVRLTSSQVAIAKKLGVPLEEYAKYV
jgi:hypothetical protein